MNLGLGSLLSRIEQSPDRPFILATVIETLGSTYRKAGAMMLLDEDNQLTGLVSGGCLEADLQQQAQSVRETGVAKVVTYDLREDDPVWGLGLGCSGLVRLLLQRAESGNEFGGLGALASYQAAGQPAVLTKTIASDKPNRVGDWAITTASALHDKPHSETIGGQQRLLIPISPPTHLLICGAGPDVPALVTLAAQCDWRISVVDHRPAYAKPSHFAEAQRVICAPVGDVIKQVSPAFDAAVVMSHHLPSDIEYARQLAATDVKYVALLGPAARRIEVMQQAGIETDQRFFGPAGLDIGADLPSTIALAILSEAHAVLNEGLGGFLRDRGHQP